MTLSSTDTFIDFLPDGAVKIFPWSNLLILESANIEVLVDEAVGGVPTGIFSVVSASTYTVTSVGPFPALAGTVTYPKGNGTALPDGSILRLRRKLELTQPKDFPNTGRIPGNSLEEGLDRIVMLVQQQAFEREELEGRIEVLEDGATPAPDPGSPGKFYLRSYLDRAELAAKTVQSSIVKLYLQFHTFPDATWNEKDTFSNRGFFVRRMRKDHIDSAGYPASAYVRSVDRWAPNTDGTGAAVEDYSSIAQSSVNGGYWVVDEDEVTPVMFGAKYDAVLATGNVLTGTDCTQAIQDAKDFLLARGGGTSGYDRYNYGKLKMGYGKCRVSGSIDCTDVGTRGRRIIFDGLGCTMYCDGADKFVWDFSDGEWFIFENFHVWANPASKPLVFLKTGRVDNNNTAARFVVRNCSCEFSTAATPKFRIAAWFSVASEGVVDEYNTWVNFNDEADDPNTYAAAFDANNALLYEAGKVVSTVTAASPGVFTVTSHGYSTGDVVVLDLVGGTFIDLNNTAYFVVSINSNTFSLTQLDGTPLATTGLVSYSTGVVFKEKYSSGKAIEDFPGASMMASPRLAPYTQHSMKHIVHIGTRFWGHECKAAIHIGEAEDNKFIGCFSNGEEGIEFAFSENTVGFTSCDFELHHETGQAAAVQAWGRFRAFDRPRGTFKTVTGVSAANPGVVTAASHGYVSGDVVVLDLTGGTFTTLNHTQYLVVWIDANTFSLTTLAGAAIDTTSLTGFSAGKSFKLNKVLDCDKVKFCEIGAAAINGMFRVTDYEDVNFFAGEIAVLRYTATFNKRIFSSSGPFAAYGTEVVLFDSFDGVNAVFNAQFFSGKMTSIADKVSLPILPRIAVALLPAATEWQGGLILCPDEVGGSTIVFSDGTNLRRVQDRAVAS